VKNEALDHFLNEFSDKLLHIAAWIAREEGAPAPIGDDSIGILRQTFEGRASANLRAINDICQRMVSAFLMLRSGC